MMNLAYDILADRLSLFVRKETSEGVVQMRCFFRPITFSYPSNCYLKFACVCTWRLMERKIGNLKTRKKLCTFFFLKKNYILFQNPINTLNFISSLDKNNISSDIFNKNFEIMYYNSNVDNIAFVFRLFAGFLYSVEHYSEQEIYTSSEWQN